MQRTTVGDVPHIQAIWPPFERLVGLRGRTMYARVDEQLGTYTVCTPLRDGDDPDGFGLLQGTLAGGCYPRGRIVDAPPESYQAIGPGMAEPKARMPSDPARPLVEFYRRHDQIELWLPIRP